MSEPLPSTAPASAALRASVLIATYNRAGKLQRLLTQLAAQTVAASQFEVIVVDDGSAEPLPPFVFPYALRVIRQDNAGQAAARDRAARLATGEVLVIVDDDMQLPPSFLEEHLRLHEGPKRRAVIGAMLAPDGAERLPLFERYNMARLQYVKDRRARGEPMRGNELCTGNVSMRRADYLAVGGFDVALRRSEDAELGLRLEQSGVEIAWSPEAWSRHDSAHGNDVWLARAHQYGEWDLRIARKHPDLAHADPWRYLYVLHPLAWPLLWLAVAMPRFSRMLARLGLATGAALESIGFARFAMHGAGFAYAIEYFRGLGEEQGGMRASRRAVRAYLVKASRSGEEVPPHFPHRRAAYARAVADFREDRAVRRDYEERYGYSGERGGGVVTKIGLQLAAAVRAMRFFREARFPLLAKITSRMIRHLYGSDIHWDAAFAPGVMFVHGMGMAIAGGARVGRGCILFQNLTLGIGVDPQTRVSGAPALGDRVHVGPGATLLGPIAVGAGSKIMAGAVLTESVPAQSLVETPRPSVKPRKGSPN